MRTRIQIRIHLFTLMRIRIRLLTFIGIRLRIFFLMRYTVDPDPVPIQSEPNLRPLGYRVQTLYGSIFSPYASIVSVCGPLWLYCELLNFDLIRIRILLFTLMRIRIRIRLPKMMWIHADPDAQHWFCLSLFVFVLSQKSVKKSWGKFPIGQQRRSTETTYIGQAQTTFRFSHLGGDKDVESPESCVTLWSHPSQGGTLWNAH